MPLSQRKSYIHYITSVDLNNTNLGIVIQVTQIAFPIQFTCEEYIVPIESEQSNEILPDAQHM